MSMYRKSRNVMHSSRVDHYSRYNLSPRTLTLYFECIPTMYIIARGYSLSVFVLSTTFISFLYFWGEVIPVRADTMPDLPRLPE